MGEPVGRLPEKFHKDFGSFWYFYLSQHMKWGTRMFHYVGTLIAFGLTGVAIYDAVTGALIGTNMRWFLIPAGILTTYILGFISHWTIEKNQPATFVYPWFSVGGDLYMTWRITTLQIHKDVNEVAARLKTGWAVDRYGLYPPDVARSRKIVTDRRLVPAAA